MPLFPDFNFKTVHRRAGLVIIVVFVATGIWMKAGFPGIDPPGHLVRALFRANHVYLLAAGLLNVAIGLYGVGNPGPARYRMQVTGSWLLLIAPLILFAAFVIDPPRETAHRYLTSVGVLLLFAGTMLHVPGRLGVGWR